MLHIVLLILKIIGFLLLGLLGLVLALAFLVLFVPIRYQLKGSFYGRPVGTAKLTWLLHLLTLTAVYDKETKIIIRLFGRRLFTPKEEKKQGRRAKRKVEKAVKKLPEKAEEPIKPLEKERKAVQKDLKTVKTETLDDRTVKQTAFWEKIKGKIKDILYALKRFCVKIVEMKHTAGRYKELWRSPECKKAWMLAKKEGKRLLRHLKPGKFTLKWRFGFEDPSLTGEVLSWMAVFYGWYRGHVMLVPDFEKAVQEGEFYCRGRIRCATLLIIFVKVYFSKNIRFVKKTLFPDEEEEMEIPESGADKEPYGNAWEM